MVWDLTSGTLKVRITVAMAITMVPDMAAETADLLHAATTTEEDHHLLTMVASHNGDKTETEVAHLRLPTDTVYLRHQQIFHVGLTCHLVVVHLAHRLRQDLVPVMVVLRTLTLTYPATTLGPTMATVRAEAAEMHTATPMLHRPREATGTTHQGGTTETWTGHHEAVSTESVTAMIGLDARAVEVPSTMTTGKRGYRTASGSSMDVRDGRNDRDAVTVIGVDTLLKNPRKGACFSKSQKESIPSTEMHILYIGAAANAY